MDLNIDILEVGEIYEHTNFIEVSMIVTYNKEYCASNPFIILNALKIESDTIYDDGVIVSMRNTSTLRIVNKTKHIPFNRRYFLLNIQYSQPENIIITFSPELAGKCNKKQYLTRFDDDHFVALLEYGRKNSIESIFKYLLIPYVLTILQQLVHRIKKDGEGEEGTDENGTNSYAGKGTWIGVAATFMLMDVALFFTFPQTNAVTGAEMCLMLNFFLKLFGTVFAFYDYDVKVSEFIGGYHGTLSDTQANHVKSIHNNVDLIQPLLTTLFCTSIAAWLYKRARTDIYKIMSSIIDNRKSGPVDLNEDTEDTGEIPDIVDVPRRNGARSVRSFQIEEEKV